MIRNLFQHVGVLLIAMLSASVPTTILGATISVPNFSFESGISNWNGGLGTWSGLGLITPTDGTQIAFLGTGAVTFDATDSNPLAANLAANTVYIMRADTGQRSDGFPAEMLASLRAGSVNLGFAGRYGGRNVSNYTPPAPGQFTTATLYATANHNATVGAALSVQLFKGGQQAHFDNVRLETVDNTVAIPVANHSFEGDPLADGNAGGVPGWTVAGAGGGSYRSAADIIPADQLQNAYIVTGGNLTQALTGYNLVGGGRYILMVDVADRLDPAIFPGYSVELLAGATTVAQDNNSLGVIRDGELTLSGGPTNYYYTTSVIDFTVPLNHAQIGQTLGIRLSAVDDGSGNAAHQTYFDNVRLFAVVPEPSSLVLLGLAIPFVIRRRRK